MLIMIAMRGCATPGFAMRQLTGFEAARARREAVARAQGPGELCARDDFIALHDPRYKPAAADIQRFSPSELNP